MYLRKAEKLGYICLQWIWQTLEMSKKYAFYGIRKNLL